MRTEAGDIRLVVADEPSAAIDPAGEYELFQNLLQEARTGKTMTFITHRFAHLTRFADLILCMKDGRLVEQGTRAELIARRGEYHGLFEVQVNAFQSEGASQPRNVEVSLYVSGPSCANQIITSELANDGEDHEGDSDDEERVDGMKNA